MNRFFYPVPLEEDGINLEKLDAVLRHNKNIKIFYSVPNYQNPTGLSYSLQKRQALQKLLTAYKIVLVEDDPYSELCFEGNTLPYIGAGKLEYSILLGTFSKTITPGMRLGYLSTTNKKLMNYINLAKQGSDLHTNIFAQYLIHDYLNHNDYEKHISIIKKLYKEQSSAMISAMQNYFPSFVSFTRPLGGMFLWVTLKEDMSALEILKEAKAQKILYVPGDPFYTNRENVNTLRLNYTNSDKEMIDEGIHRLGTIFHKYD